MEPSSISGESTTLSENLNPNVPKPSNFSATKCSNPKRTPLVSTSPQNRIRQRKFVVAKKNPQKKNDDVSCKCKVNGNIKCVCVAYQNLRASQEEFFLREKTLDEDEEEKAENTVHEETEEKEAEEEEEGCEVEEGSSTVKRRRDRDRLMEEARNSVPESGKVMHLVKAFEKLLTLPKEKKNKDLQKEEEIENENKNKVMKWALPGLQLGEPPKAPEKSEDASVSCSVSDPSSFSYTSELVLTSENLGFDNRKNSVASSWDSGNIGSVGSRTSSGGRRSRRNSLESCGTFGEGRWRKKKQLRVTSQKPFKLRTEQRGKLKEEEFTRKVQEMLIEEEKLRIPIAQGLPWTTDEPECLVKPPVKESTKPIDLKLHSDVRAIDRAEFDHQVAEKMSLIEQYKLERERQQKLAEEEEIRRLRKELIPKAQPMPYFDRPFVPRRSTKHPTIPREPKFHIPQHKKIKCCLSWNDMNPYTSYHS